MKTTLKNGLIVFNFSSPHQFVFDDGTILGACSPERARALMLEATETQVPYRLPKKWTDISLEFHMSEAVEQELNKLHGERFSDVDIILVPLPVLQCAKIVRLTRGSKLWPKIRCIRVADRATKTIFSDKFTV